jgi:predicted Zn-dependent protease
MLLILSHQRARRLLCAGALVFAFIPGASAQDAKASGGQLIAPAEVVLYVHSDLKSTDFVQPLVCALQRVLNAQVSTQTLALPLGSELRANPEQFDTAKVASRFFRATAKDGTSPSFKYLLLPFDMTAETFPYQFASSYNDTTGQYHIGIVSTARLDPADPRQAHHQGFEITAQRVYKVILRSMGRLAGLRGQGACVLASPQSLEGLDRKSPAFCREDHEALVAAGVLKSTESAEGTDCMGISLWRPLRSPTRIVRVEEE